MKATLYDALGILPTSSEEDVRAALRGLIRKYYAKTRDGQGNVEEALRFINHASRILSDGERRERYDLELLESTFTADVPPMPLLGKTLPGENDASDALLPTRPGDEDGDDPLDSVVGAAVSPAPAPASHHPGLTQRVASFGRSPVLTTGLCGLFAAFIIAAIVFVTPPDFVVVARNVLGWLTAAFAALAAVYGIVHGLVYVRRHHASTRSALSPQTDLAILNWRRERSVFLGTNHPQEDASWIFQLRMAELERAKSGRTSEPRPWHRLAARTFDYAIWGLLLALLLSQVRALDLLTPSTVYWLGHPLLAPILITLSWIPIEALLITSVGTTPGKWLFGIYLQFSISNAYARRDTLAQLLRGLNRAFRVWFEGVGCGFPLLAPVLTAVAYEKLAENQETDWDFAADCLVTHGPAGVLNTVTGVCGLASMMWLYGVAWQQPMNDSLGWTRMTVSQLLPSAATLKLELSKASGALDQWLPSTAPAPPMRATSPVASAPAAVAARANATPLSAPRGDAVTRPAERPGGGRPATVPAPRGAAFADPGDAKFSDMMASRAARLEMVKIEGPRMLRAGNARRAAELCRAWADLDLANPDAWRCLGRAEQALGAHQDALNAFRKAKQFDPLDRTLDASIEKSQRSIVAGFLDRYRR